MTTNMLTFVSTVLMLLLTVFTTSSEGQDPDRLVPVLPIRPIRPPCARENCTNDICREKGLVACGSCEKLDYAPVQVSQCCPRGYFCCSSSLPWMRRPVCCPRGSICDRRGRCIQSTVQRSRPSETSCNQCDPMKLNITVDNEVTKLYVDGVLRSLANPNDWTKVDTVTIPADTRVIAVQGRDRGVIAGILASIGDDYFVTDASWKCTTRYYTNWMQPSYNDSSWPAAVISQTNTAGNPYHGVRPEISTIAKWIWTRNFFSRADPIVYCRGYLPTDICNKSYGNCTNPCEAENKECCHCEMANLGPTKVCSCCPQGSTCCPFTPGGSSSPTCCPRGFTCNRNGSCSQTIVTKPVPPQTECGPCRYRRRTQAEPDVAEGDAVKKTAAATDEV